MVIQHGGEIRETAHSLGVDWREILDFSASINPLGPSPAAREAILSAVDSIAHYPSRGGDRLRRRLAELWQVDAGRILAGNGATELLFDWCRHVGQGAIAAPAFSEFHRAWPDAAVCRLDEPASWPRELPLVLTRPANPSGHIPRLDTVVEFARRRSAPLLVDESFLDFAPGAESLLAHARGNLFVLRSLTKFWALPGLRAGVLVGDVDAIASRRPPWALNALAEEAALASIDDVGHAERTRAFVAGEACWLARQLSSIRGLRVTAPTANFVYAETSHAARLEAFARERRILIRNCSGWPGFGAPAIRVAVRLRWENEILIRTFQECLCD